MSDESTGPDKTPQNPPKMTTRKTPATDDPAELTDEQLDDASGGIGLLLPAVQKVPERSAGTGGRRRSKKATRKRS